MGTVYRRMFFTLATLSALAVTAAGNAQRLAGDSDRPAASGDEAPGRADTAATDSAAAEAISPSSAAGATSPVPGLTIEEVIVYGNRTLDSLRQEVFRAEEAFYDAFNAVNSTDEYDISCKRRAATGSRMLHRVCEARFVKDLNADLAKAILRGDPPPPINPIIMYKGRLLLAEMQTIAREDPLVLQALIRLAEIRQKFDEEHERRCAGRIFCQR